MALSFPLSLAAFQDRLRVAEAIPFRLQRFEQTSGTGAGQPIVAEIAPPAWVATFNLAAMPLAQAAEVDGLMEAIGSIGRVYLFDPTKRWPARDPGGSIIAGSTPVVSALGSDRKSFRLSGVPGGYVLTAGDLVSVAYGDSRRALFRLAESVTASSSGVTPFFTVSPHLPIGVAAGASATLRRPTARFVITSWDPGRAAGLHRIGMTFSAVEVPR